MHINNDILISLPHDLPAIYIDRITSININENILIAEKDINMSDFLLQGHFPDNPIMPGIYCIESLAQSCIIYDYHARNGFNYTKKNNRNYLLFKVDVKFRNKVVPNDTIILQSSLKESFGELNIFKVIATRKSDNKIVTQGEITVLIN